MGFGVKAADIKAIKEKTELIPASPADNTIVLAIKAKTDSLPADPASESGSIADILSQTSLLPADPASESGALKTDLDSLLTSVPRVQPWMDFWSGPGAGVSIGATPADIVWLSVSIPAFGGLPAGATITRVVAMLKVKAIGDSSGSDNYIVEANKYIRIIKSGGTWGTDDIVALVFVADQWYTTANAKENGDVIIGEPADDLSSVVDGAGDYDFVSAETATYGSRGDAPYAAGDTLDLYDFEIGLRVYFTV